eukprot:7575138-Pyramimonas_sp.AAC.1
MINFCCAPFFGLPRPSRFPEDVPSESAMFYMRSGKAAFLTNHLFEDVSGETLIFMHHKILDIFRHPDLLRMS